MSLCQWKDLLKRWLFHEKHMQTLSRKRKKREDGMAFSFYLGWLPWLPRGIPLSHTECLVFLSSIIGVHVSKPKISPRSISFVYASLSSILWIRFIDGLERKLDNSCLHKSFAVQEFYWSIGSFGASYASVILYLVAPQVLSGGLVTN